LGPVVLALLQQAAIKVVLGNLHLRCQFQQLVEAVVEPSLEQAPQTGLD
jgi:hypothetical protein